jgi:hypothetical protein
MMGVLLSTAYLPNTEYFTCLLNQDPVIIEAHEHFQKQSYRNRCEILSANGKLNLSIPLQKNADKELITEKKISYAENWQMQHWRAITSAYKNTPYFEFFEDEFKPFYFEQHEFLFDFNTKVVRTILNILRIKKKIRFTSEFQTGSQLNDLRDFIHPKNVSKMEFKPYKQVFGEKFGFVPNLSVIDLLFNQGLKSKDYLTL